MINEDMISDQRNHLLMDAARARALDFKCLLNYCLFKVRSFKRRAEEVGGVDIIQRTRSYTVHLATIVRYTFTVAALSALSAFKIEAMCSCQYIYVRIFG